MTRTEVYRIIDGERAYQDDTWSSPRSTPDAHSMVEWFTFIEDYVNEAKRAASRPKRYTTNIAAVNMRKVAAMAVAAMEQHGAPPRALP